jgi:hypothetical protein
MMQYVLRFSGSIQVMDHDSKHHGTRGSILSILTCGIENEEFSLLPLGLVLSAPV